MTLAEKVKKRREFLGLTQDDLAKKMGYSSRSSINKIENGRSVSQKIIAKLADALGVSEPYLMGFEKLEDSLTPNDFKEKEIIELKEDKKSHCEIPIIGKVPCKSFELTDKHEDSEYIELDKTIKGDFAVRVANNSMSGASIFDHDLVICENQKSLAGNGEIALVAFNDEVTLRKVFQFSKVGGIILKSENPEYPDILIGEDELSNLKVMGKATFVIRELK